MIGVLPGAHQSGDIGRYRADIGRCLGLISRKTSNISSAEMRPLPLTSYSAKANWSFSSSVAQSLRSVASKKSFWSCSERSSSRRCDKGSRARLDDAVAAMNRIVFNLEEEEEEEEEEEDDDSAG